MIYDIIIIGAGAAGLSAAYQAISDNPKLNILVLDKEKVPGRKLSASGNGKCNLTNADFSKDCYFSSNHEWVNHWMEYHSFEEVLNFFKTLGILLYETNGYYYPLSNKGKQVTTILYEKSKALNVSYLFESKVHSIHCLKSSIYEVKIENSSQKLEKYITKNLILALGGNAAPKIGGTQDGYNLAKKLGLKVHPIYPALTQANIIDPYLKYAKGVRINAMVSLNYNHHIIKEFGQVQFNESSLSGIVIMNLSCMFQKMNEEFLKDSLTLDFFPYFSWDELKDFVNKQKISNPNQTIRLLLSGLLPDPFIYYFLKRLKIEENHIVSELHDKQINRIVSNLKKLTFSPNHTNEFDKAQVTGGGVSLNELKTQSFETITYKNLYIVGELLDVHGKCGGYNLTFAILSGIQAVKEIDRNNKNDRNS